MSLFNYLKVPVEMAEFALRERQVSKVGVYLTAQKIYSGKAPTGNETVTKIGSACDLKPRSVYKALRWLQNRNWIGKNTSDGWMFFNSINQVHQTERWKYSRSALMYDKDLQSIKPFLIGAFLASVCRSGNMGTGTERLSKRSESSPNPVSLSFIEKALKVSNKTAYNYRKLAEKYQYIKMYQNLRQVKGINLSDVKQMKQNHVDNVMVPLFGSTKTISVKPDQLICEKGIVYVQLPNLILPLIPLGKRNLRRYRYPKPILPCGSC